MALSVEQDDRRHLPLLDGVRGIAIVTVMAYHFYGGFQGPEWWDRSIYWLIETGWAGVDLFFVLSGFLITRNLLQAKGKPHGFRNFYARRILRIFPLYYASLILFLFLLPMAFPNWNRPEIATYQQNQIWFWLHLSNQFSFKSDHAGFLYHFWSLAIEEQFYLLWPAIVFLTRAGRMRQMCLIFITLGITSRLVGLTALGWNTHALHLLLPARFDTLAIGGYLATLSARERTDTIRRGWPWLVGIALLVALSFPLQQLVGAARTFRHVIYFTALAMAFGYLILLVCEPPRGSLVQRLTGWSFLRHLGKYSYSLYLFHSVIARNFPIPPATFIRWFKLPLLAGIVFGIILGSISYLCSVLCWELLEKRFLALKRYFPAVPPGDRSEAPPAPPVRRVAGL